ncbi:hypothetical protein ACH5RR_020346 [Cinchona calisaya]|uniref:Uncharacterized protein n=1 Tax=Cinchona calisaya TaxID=153742 RepID=A0ABD2ZI03_9GENT
MGFRELRKRLIIELDNLLPPPITLPERRLKHLVEMAVLSDPEKGIYKWDSEDNKLKAVKGDECLKFQILPSHMMENIISAYSWTKKYTY